MLYCSNRAEEVMFGEAEHQHLLPQVLEMVCDWSVAQKCSSSILRTLFNTWDLGPCSLCSAAGELFSFLCRVTSTIMRGRCSLRARMVKLPGVVVGSNFCALGILLYDIVGNQQPGMTRWWNKVSRSEFLEFRHMCSRALRTKNIVLLVQPHLHTLSKNTIYNYITGLFYKLIIKQKVLFCSAFI